MEFNNSMGDEEEITYSNAMDDLSENLNRDDEGT